MKKRWIAWMLVLALCAAMTGVSAEEKPLEEMTYAVQDLLFRTDNVTLEGEATFSLDKKVFKTAKVRCVQDGENSLLELDLRTPRKDGTEARSGYTIIGNGEYVYVIEAIHPEVFRTGTGYATSSIVHESIQTRVLADFFRLMAAQSDAFLGEDALTAKRDGDQLELRLQLGMHGPEMVDVALNLAAQFAAKRWFGMDSDFPSPDMGTSMSSFLTPTQGILWTARSLSLLEADVTLKTAGFATFGSAEGHVYTLLDTVADGMRPLDVTFTLRASDYGTSKVADFDPADYGVELAEDCMLYDD